MARWTILCIVGCWLIVVSPVGRTAVAPAAGGPTAASRECLRCHESEGKILTSLMASRSGERAFARRALGEEGDRFFAEACGGCHVAGCADCHGADPHRAGRPRDEACLRCHRGYSAGWEYEGKAPREDHERYQRGAISQGERYLTMLPDVHFERGMSCGDCHPMRSLHTGRQGAKGCRDCHQAAATGNPDHAIAGHLEKVECVACHAAWASQEYGTFLVRPKTEAEDGAFAPLPRWGPWRKSSHLKRQDAPPLGLDARGLVAPIRPRYVLFAPTLAGVGKTDSLAAEWRAFSPHTVRRGSVACGGCHENPRRFLLEPDAERLYLLEKDGLTLRSYWNRDGQRVDNGSFLPLARHELMNRKTPEFARQELKQWQRLLEHAAPRSRR